MRIAIIVSRKDKAGMNIASFLEKKDLEKYNTKLSYLEKDTVYSDDLDKQIDADLFIFATRHQSKEEKPSLSLHTQGNWSKAEYGGKDKELAVNSADYIKAAFQILNKDCKLDEYEITLECTHHGPSLNKPSMFIEIGSTEKQWTNPKAGELIANTIIKLIKTKLKKHKIAIGIGGPHYCSNFNKIELNSDIAMSHICPKYMLDKIDKQMIQQAIEKTQGKVDLILLDWKGLGQEKEKIKQITEELGIKTERTTNIEK